MADVQQADTTRAQLLAGRTVAVMGCGPGIGGAIASVAASYGATVACLDLNAEVAEAAVEQLRAQGFSAAPYRANVVERSEVRDVLACVVADHGALHGVVDVVGLSLMKPQVKMDDDDWTFQFDINARQQFVAMQESVGHLAVQGGSYVAIGTVDAHFPSPDRALYGAAKASVLALSRSFALEYGRQGVRFNVVSPGIVRTPRTMARGTTSSGSLAQAFTDVIPLGRLGEPVDIANAVLFLLSDLSSYVSGQVLTVDGGASTHTIFPVRQVGK